MKIHYTQIAKLLTVIFVSLAGLAIAGLFGFNFSLDIIFGFKIWFVLFLVYFVFELFKNKKEVELRLNQWFDKELGLLAERQKKTNFFLFFWTTIKIIFGLVFSKYLFLTVCAVGIYYEIFLLADFSDFLVLFLLVFWLITAKKFSFGSQISAGAAIFFLILTPIYLISGKELLAEKTANWAYMFLVATVIQLWRESKKETEDDPSRINFDKIKKSLLKVGEFIVKIDS